MPLSEKLKDENARLRIPERHKKAKMDFTMNNIGNDGESQVHDLLQEHMKQWQSVRQDWKQAYAVNEERYKDSMKILKDMFERE